MKPGSQKARILKMLEAAGEKGIRSDHFYRDEVKLPRAAARIGELINDHGYPITTRDEHPFVRYFLKLDATCPPCRVASTEPGADAPLSLLPSQEDAPPAQSSSAYDPWSDVA